VCQSFVDAADVLGSDAACHIDTRDEQTAQDAGDAASDIVYALTGGLYTGICTVTRRPVHRDICRDPGTEHLISNWSDYYSQDVIPMPYNLISVEEVIIDGVTLDPSEYRVFDGRFLARSDGGDWPRTNRLWLDSTEEHTFELVIKFGTPPDWLAIASATEIAVKLLVDDAGGGSYLRNITSASVQGASVQIDKAAASMAAAGMPMTQTLIGAFVNQGGHPAGAISPAFDEQWVLIEVSGPSGS